MRKRRNVAQMGGTGWLSAAGSGGMQGHVVRACDKVQHQSYMMKQRDEGITDRQWTPKMFGVWCVFGFITPPLMFRVMTTQGRAGRHVLSCATTSAPHTYRHI